MKGIPAEFKFLDKVSGFRFSIGDDGPKLVGLSVEPLYLSGVLFLSCILGLDLGRGPCLEDESPCVID